MPEFSGQPLQLLRKCYGCAHEFVDKYRQHPYNIVVKYVDRRVLWKDPLTGSFVYSIDFTNTYYHPSSLYIRRKNPLFTGPVRLSSNLYAALSVAQKQVLESNDLNVQITN